MLKIALCDDEQAQRELTGALLEEYLSQRPELCCEVTPFPSAAALLTRAEQGGGFDLYLLDVLMPGENGIDLGLELRKRDASTVIIYLTTSPDYAVGSYLARAFYYLLKPLRSKTLSPVLDEAIAKLTRTRNEAVTVRTRDGTHRVTLASVVSAELVKKRCATASQTEARWRVFKSAARSGTRWRPCWSSPNSPSAPPPMW